MTVILPLSLFATLDLGFRHQYWGLNRNLQPPASTAWVPDTKCDPSLLKRPCLHLASKLRPTVLLIGDSHASHFSSALIASGKEMNWNVAVWTLGRCHFQFLRSKDSEVTDQCLTQNQSILNWIQYQNPTTIILSQYIKRDSSQSNLREALKSLWKVNPNILIIENTPVFPDGKDFMVQRPLILSPYKPAKTFRLSEMSIEDRKASDLFSKWARNIGISTVNFESLFCKGGICTRYSKGKWLYADSDHLSIEGAALTIPIFTSYLKTFEHSHIDF